MRKSLLGLAPPLTLWIRAALVLPLAPAFWLVGWETGAHFAVLTTMMTLIGGVLTRLTQRLEPRVKHWLGWD